MADGGARARSPIASRAGSIQQLLWGYVFFDPVQDSRDELVIELVVHGKVVRHVIDLKIASTSRMDLVDDLHDGVAVCPAHDRVVGPVDDEHRSTDVLPDFAEVQGL